MEKTDEIRVMHERFFNEESIDLRDEADRNHP